MIEFNDRRERAKEERIAMVKSVMAKQPKPETDASGYFSTKPVSKRVVKKANKMYKRGTK